MANPKMTHEMMAEAVKAVRDYGNVSAAAKALGKDRTTMQSRLRAAEAAGLTKRQTIANPSRWRPFDEIVAARKGEFERVKAAGDGRSLNTVMLPDDGPFCVIFYGDPHLDNPGTDLKLWERWVAPLNRAKHVYGFGLGDYLDNWLRVLGHLYATAETTAPEGWILMEGYLDRMAEHLLGSVGGNHDAWSGHADLLAQLMVERGVLHRNNALRIALRTPSMREVTIGARHAFKGNSQWNPAHAITKAAQLGWRDTILVGGHTHVSGQGLVRDPDTGRLTWAYQVASFKMFDDYADTLGLMDKHVSPAIACVIDPRRPDTDPQLVTTFHDPEAAVSYLASLRRKK